MHAAVREPWKVAGWLTVALLGLVLFIPCLVGVGLIVPWLSYRSAQAELATLAFDWDADQVVDIKLQGGVWPDVRDFSVNSKPYLIRLPAGTYTAKITYRHADKEYTFEHALTVAKVRESQLQLLGPMIQSDLEERLKEKALPVRPLGERADPETGSLIFDWDETKGIRVAEIRALTSASQFGEIYEVKSRPFAMQLPTGQYTLRVLLMDSRGPNAAFTFEKFVAVAPGENRIDLGPDIQRNFPNGLPKGPGGSEK
jgi:hypothetical protein